jgi:hypothetical protein
MDKPRIFLGSSGKQEKLLQALTRGLSDIARVEPWMTSFNPGTSTLERLLELTQEVDFAAFIFAQDDWTTGSPSVHAITSCSKPVSSAVFLECAEHFSPCKRGEASDRPPGPHVRTVCRHADTVRDENRNQKIRNAIENELRVTRIDGSWWQFSLTERTAKEPSALSLLKISRDRNGALEVRGRSWREDGNLSARYWSEAAKEKEGPSGVFYYWKGERPLDPNAPQLDGVG